jgi:hypothetical protein
VFPELHELEHEVQLAPDAPDDRLVGENDGAGALTGPAETSTGVQVGEVNALP